MMRLKFNILNIVLIKVLLIQLAIDATNGVPECGPNACQKIKCVPLEQVQQQCVLRKGIVNEKSGWCSCCPTCVKKLYEDQNCEVTLSPQLPVRAQCLEGLICSLKTKRCVKI